VKTVGPEREKQRICKYLLHCLQPSIWATDHKTTLVYRFGLPTLRPVMKFLPLSCELLIFVAVTVIFYLKIAVMRIAFIFVLIND
jgi:hypothetical protein